MKDFTPIATIAGSLIALILGYLLYKRKHEAEVEKIRAEAKDVEIGNVDSVINLWKKIAEDMSKQVLSLENQVSLLREENRKLRHDVSRLEEIIKEKTN